MLGTAIGKPRASSSHHTGNTATAYHPDDLNTAGRRAHRGWRDDRHRRLVWHRFLDTLYHCGFRDNNITHSLPCAGVNLGIDAAVVSATFTGMYEAKLLWQWLYAASAH